MSSSIFFEVFLKREQNLITIIILKPVLMWVAQMVVTRISMNVLASVT
jgi:hypothetical protein